MGKRGSGRLPEDYVEKMAGKERGPVFRVSEAVPDLPRMWFCLLRKRELEEELREMPPGSLRCRASGYLAVQITFRGKKMEQRVPEELRPVIERLYRQRDELRSELAAIRGELSFYWKDPALNMRRAVAEVSRLRRFKLLSREYRHPDRCIHQTLRGEFVASKSEAMIANILYMYGVRYEYSRPLILGGKTIYPDFTIYAGGKVFYWEHLGLLDVPEYLAEWNYKETYYNQAGIRQDSNLIITRDHAGAFHSFEIVLVLQKYGIIDGKGRKKVG